MPAAPDTDIDARIRAIGDDRIHGASELARECLRIAADCAQQETAASTQELLDGLRRRGAQLAVTRPSMAAPHNLVRAWLDRLPGFAVLELPAARAAAATAAQAMIERSHGALDALATHASNLVANAQTIITHSLSSTVVEVLARLRTSSVHIIVTESRPLCEGRQLARRLSEWGMAATLITDAALGLYAAKAELALVGADSLLVDGSLVNKIGTYPLALAARDCGIPFYVCCETFKQRTPDMPPLVLEEMDIAELGAPDLPGVKVSNVYFDITPARLISAWANEHGVVGRDIA